jgi:hypothetical protein
MATETTDLPGALVTLLPPPIATGFGASKDTGANPVAVYGRSYTCAVGASLQVPAQDASVLIANGWTRFMRFSGTTAQRPTNATRGTTYLDTTVGHGIVFDGVTWRDSDGTSV